MRYLIRGESGPKLLWPSSMINCEKRVSSLYKFEMLGS